MWRTSQKATIRQLQLQRDRGSVVASEPDCLVPSGSINFSVILDLKFSVQALFNAISRLDSSIFQGSDLGTFSLVVVLLRPNKLL